MGDGLNPFTIIQTARLISQAVTGMAAIAPRRRFVGKAEQLCGARSEDHGATNKAQHGNDPWNKSEPVHQVREQERVDADGQRAATASMVSSL
jgi:hypothetical protein